MNIGVQKQWKIPLTLKIWRGPLSHHPLRPVSVYPHPLIPSTQTNNHKEAQNPKNDQLQTNRIVFPWPMYAEPMAKTGRLGIHPKER